MSSRNGKRSTITDVARMAGTSVTTVSRVLNNIDYPVSEQLRQRVKEAVNSLDYVPSVMARSLKGSTMQDIGVVIPNMSNPFYLQTMLGINSVTYNKNFGLLVCNTMRNLDKEREYLRRLYDRQVRGIILSSLTDDADLVRDYIRKGVRFVLLDQKIENINCSCINFDSRKGARIAMRYLIEQGHKRIALVTTPLTRWTRNEVFKGYNEAISAAGLKFNEDLVFISGPEPANKEVDFEYHAGRQLGNHFARSMNRATAVLCINDMVAFGFIKSLNKNGIKVPDDVSVMGFDNIPFAESFMPSLTTIQYPAYETGRLATIMLIDKMQNQDDSMSINMSLEPRLIIRETVNSLK